MRRKSVVSMDLALLTLEGDIRWGKGGVIFEAWKVYNQLRENIRGIVIEIQSQHNFINIDFVLLWFISPKHFYNTLFRKYVVTNLNQLSAVSLDSIFYSLIKNKTAYLLLCWGNWKSFLSVVCLLSWTILYHFLCILELLCFNCIFFGKRNECVSGWAVAIRSIIQCIRSIIILLRYSQFLQFVRTTNIPGNI